MQRECPESMVNFTLSKQKGKVKLCFLETSSIENGNFAIMNDLERVDLQNYKSVVIMIKVF
jgi:hypothetical protein